MWWWLTHTYTRTNSHINVILLKNRWKSSSQRLIQNWLPSEHQAATASSSSTPPPSSSFDIEKRLFNQERLCSVGIHCVINNNNHIQILSYLHIIWCYQHKHIVSVSTVAQAGTHARTHTHKHTSRWWWIRRRRTRTRRIRKEWFVLASMAQVQDYYMLKEQSDTHTHKHIIRTVLSKYEQKVGKKLFTLIFIVTKIDS